MTATDPTHLLDNPVWSALTGIQRGFGVTNELAGRFASDRSPFGAFCEEPGRDHWQAMAELVGPRGVVGPVGVLGDVPEGWTQIWKGHGLQMVGDRISAAPADGPPGELADVVVDLGKDDVDDMLDLVALAEPGPFERRTIEFGGYVGVRRHGRLVAMAGERMQLPGFSEISAVATHPEARREGLARELVSRVARSIIDRGNTPVLHASSTNQAAIALYRAMGFTPRRLITFGRVQAPG